MPFFWPIVAWTVGRALVGWIAGVGIAGTIEIINDALMDGEIERAEEAFNELHRDREDDLRQYWDQHKHDMDPRLKRVFEKRL